MQREQITSNRQGQPAAQDLVLPRGLEILIQGGLVTPQERAVIRGLTGPAIADFLTEAPWRGNREALRNRETRRVLEETLLDKAEGVSIDALADLIHRYRGEKSDRTTFLHRLTSSCSASSSFDIAPAKAKSAVRLVREMGLAHVISPSALDRSIEIIQAGITILSEADRAETVRALGTLHTEYPVFMGRLTDSLLDDIPSMDSRLATIIGMGMGEAMFRDEKAWNALSRHFLKNMRQYKTEEVAIMLRNASLAGGRCFERMWDAAVCGENPVQFRFEWLRMAGRAGLLRGVELPPHISLCRKPHFLEREDYGKYRDVETEIARALKDLGVPFRTSVPANTYSVGVVASINGAEINLKPTIAWRDSMDYKAGSRLKGTEVLRDRLVEMTGIKVKRVQVEDLREKDPRQFIADLLAQAT